MTLIQFPLDPETPLKNPQDFLFGIGHDSRDLGAYCYLHRLAARRKPGKPTKVALASFSSRRAGQIARLLTILSAMMVEGGLRPQTIIAIWDPVGKFLNWADQSGYDNCLNGGEETREAFRVWASLVEERLRRHEIKAVTASLLQRSVLDVLGLYAEDKHLSRGVRLVSGKQTSSGTEPVATKDFVQILAVQQALFDGLAKLVIDEQDFPYKLEMPQSLGWTDSHLWCFPDSTWHVAPSLRQSGLAVAEGTWAFDYKSGEIADVHAIRERYRRPNAARRAVARAQAALSASNSDPFCRMRVSLGRLASEAFLSLFLANTGCNLAVATSIETDGTLDSSTTNQSYRALKFRASGKVVAVVIPVAFMPTLRMYLKLREYLLRGKKYPYLFFSFRGRIHDELVPGAVHDEVFDRLSRFVQGVLPGVQPMRARAIRASVDDYYRRTNDRSITARVMGRTEAVTDRHYLAGSPIDHQDEMTLFLQEVSQAARRQAVVSSAHRPFGAKALEEGGSCSSFGHPQSLARDRAVPDCRTGCIFCANRVLIANQDDTRKVASAAFLMEQLIVGPLSEAELRPKIKKCEEDLKLIASFPGCEMMVNAVRKDVSENGNLTPYFRDKYELFLELGVL